MIIGEFQGEVFAFRVEEAYHGYLVRPLDLVTGQSHDQEALLFRTASTAFAYAEMIASAERFSFGEDDDAELAGDFRRTEELFHALRGRLVDDGAPLPLVEAHAAGGQPTHRPTVH
jgi:hypothetical protein